MTVQVKAGLWTYGQGDPIKLSSCRLDGTIQNTVCSLNLVMTYVLEPNKEALDALFRFPLYDLGTVTAFEAFVNMKTLVKARVRPKGEVEEDLKTAGLPGWYNEEMLDLNATDLLVCRLGKLQPSSNVRVKISFTSSLTLVNDMLSLVLPPTIVQKTYAAEGAAPQEFPLQVDIAVSMFDSVKRIISPLYPLMFVSTPNRNGFEGKIVPEAKSPNPKAPLPTVNDYDIVISFELASPFKSSLPRAFIEQAAARTRHRRCLFNLLIFSLQNVSSRLSAALTLVLLARPGMAGPNTTVVQFVWKPEFDLPAVIRIDDGDEDDEEGDPEPRDILFVVDKAQRDAPSLKDVRHAVTKAINEVNGNHQVHFNVIVLSKKREVLFEKSAIADEGALRSVAQVCLSVLMVLLSLSSRQAGARVCEL